MRFFQLTFFLCAVFIGMAGAHAATALPFQYRDGMVWVKVEVAGRHEPLNFLLDSGAGVSVIDIAAAQRLGLHLDQPEAVQGVGGRATAYRLREFHAQVAHIPIASSLLAVDLSAPSRSCHQHIDGLLGADFFRDHIVQIDYAAQTIRLLERTELDLSAGELLPLVKSNDTFCARASVGGGAPGLLRVDTGCSSALEWVAEGETAKKARTATIGISPGQSREFCTNVRLNSLCISGVKTGIHSAPMFYGESGLMGNGLLSRFTVTIDAKKCICILASRRETASK